MAQSKRKIAKKTRTTHTPKPKTFTYEYLLIEYLKEISNEITYTILITTSLFILLMLDIFQPKNIQSFELIRTVFIVFIVGGFFMYGLSSWTKRRIENRFNNILH